MDRVPDQIVADELLLACEACIGYRFQDRGLLRSALTHASGANHRLASNERLEFLGDAIMGAVVCDLLYARFPNYLEGELTKIKSVVVSRSTCAKVSTRLGLLDYLILGRGMPGGDQIPRSVLSDVFESLVAATYLDGGFQAAKAFVETHMSPEIDAAAQGAADGNYKSTLQHVAQRDFGATPTYQLVDEKGPDHEKSFQMAAQIGKQEYPAAWGRNKKEAEQRAARNALRYLGHQTDKRSEVNEEEEGDDPGI